MDSSSLSASFWILPGIKSTTKFAIAIDNLPHVAMNAGETRIAARQRRNL
jgi:hypothetical protein